MMQETARKACKQENQGEREHLEKAASGLHQ